MVDVNGQILAEGVEECSMQASGDVSGSILFLHQTIVQIIKVHRCGTPYMVEDGGIISECIGQMIRWPKHLLRVIQRSISGDESTQSFEFENEVVENQSVHEQPWHKDSL